MPETPEQRKAREAAAQAAELAAARERIAAWCARNPWSGDATLMAHFCALATIGAAGRLLWAPPLAVAAAAWLALAALLAWWCWYRPGAIPPNPGGWRPGDTKPEGIPDASLAAVVPVLDGAAFPVWLQAAACQDPVGHGACTLAATSRVSGGILVTLGEHQAEDPPVAAFTVAHEMRHPRGLWCHLSIAATYLRHPGWLIAGWAVPWPWLILAVAAVRAAHLAVYWLLELGCDVGGARDAGREAALATFAKGREMSRAPRPGPAWRRRAVWLLVRVTGKAPHPPLELRCAVIRALVR